jgi:hypothetical protein
MDLAEAPPGQRLNGGQQGAGAALLIGVVLFAHLARSHRHRQQRLTDQKTGPFIKANHRILRVVGQGIQGQNVLHACKKERIEGANAPGLRQMRFQLVFFRMVPTVVCERASQKPASTTFSASKRKVQRS